jgi:preprotein translocase subunit SecE
MARPTRQQRRARRAGRSSSALAEQTRASKQASSLLPQKSEVAKKGLPGMGFIRFIGESSAELKKVEWPGRQQLIQGTVVVIVACAIVGGYLAIADLAFKHLVQNVLLG